MGVGGRTGTAPGFSFAPLSHSLNFRNLPTHTPTSRNNNLPTHSPTSQVLAIELLAACQGLEFLRPLETTPPLERVYRLVRTVAKPWDGDRFMHPDMEAVHRLIKEGSVWKAAGIS